MCQNNIHLTPIFAAFSFESADKSRSAWRAIEASDPSNISCWAFTDPQRTTFLLAILGEVQENVDRAAYIALEQPGIIDNYVLDQTTMRALMQRRYGTIADAIAKGEGVHQRASYGAGAPLNARGEILGNPDGPA